MRMCRHNDDDDEDDDDDAGPFCLAPFWRWGLEPQMWWMVMPEGMRRRTTLLSDVDANFHTHPWWWDGLASLCSFNPHHFEDVLTSCKMPRHGSLKLDGLCFLLMLKQDVQADALARCWCLMLLISEKWWPMSSDDHVPADCLIIFDDVDQDDHMHLDARWSVIFDVDVDAAMFIYRCHERWLYTMVLPDGLADVFIGWSWLFHTLDEIWCCWRKCSDEPLCLWWDVGIHQEVDSTKGAEITLFTS